jgi:plasmid stabilization system protein ParE
MNYKIIVQPEAQTDITESWIWYEEQRFGLGEEFISELDVVFEKLMLMPEAYTKVTKHIRQAILK